MINGKRILAVIPARGGSKGIPKKNIIKVDGKPLIQFSIDSAKQSKYIDEIHVSTENLEIATVAKSLGISIPRLRPLSLAQDNSRTIDVMMDVIEYYQGKGKIFDIVILLQPTQPLRNTSHIDAAIELFVRSNGKSIVSVTEVEEHPVLMRKIDNKGMLHSILGENSTVRRQDFEKFYIVNGAIYINKTEELTSNTSLNDNLIPFFMNRDYHLDIDTYEDLNFFVEYIQCGGKR